jgi:hypothetical protein
VQLRPNDPESKGIVERRNGFFGACQVFCVRQLVLVIGGVWS